MDYKDITNNVSITGNINVNSINFNLNSTVINYIANLTSDCQTQLNSINKKLTGISYNVVYYIQTS